MKYLLYGGVILGVAYVLYPTQVSGWLLPALGLRPINPQNVNQPAVPPQTVVDPAPISNPDNPAQTGYTGAVRSQLGADTFPSFSSKRSRRNSIISY